MARPVTPEQADFFRRWQSGGGRIPMSTDERGLRYSVDPNGKRLYYLDYETTPKPKTNFFSDMDWDPKTGTWKRTTNKSRIASAAILGVIGGGAAAGVVGGAASGVPAVSAASSLAPAAAATGGVTAATTGGTMAGGWLGPLLNYGVPAVTSLIGQHRQNSADAEAARIQTEFLDRALAVEKEKEQYGRGQYADYLGRLKPYGDQGQAAVGRAGNLLTSSSYRPDMAAGGPPAAGMVALRDSAGTVRHVPAKEEDYWLQKGAQRA